MFAYLEDLKLPIDNYVLDYFVIGVIVSVLLCHSELLILSFWAIAKNPHMRPFGLRLRVTFKKVKVKKRVTEKASFWTERKRSEESHPFPSKNQRRIPSLFHHSDFSIIECLHSGQPFVAFIPNNERMSSRNLFPIGNFRRKIFSWQRYYFLWYKNEVSGKFVVRHHYLIFDKFVYTFYRNINVLSVLLR